MRLKIDGRITIMDAPSDIIQTIKDYCTISNPQYRMMLAMLKKDKSKERNKMRFAIKPDFKYYKDYGLGLKVGRGMSTYLISLFEQKGIKYTYGIDRVYPRVDKTLEQKIILRDYQVGRDEIVLQHKQGIIKLGTGWGKTPFAFRLVERTQLKTLIVCCKSETSELHKYKTDFKRFYNREIGIIQGDKFSLQDITVATASTLVQRNVSEISDKFGMIIVDEAHVGMSNKRIEMLQKFNPLRFYGMTGTPGRANGQSRAMAFYYGPIIIDEKLPQENPIVHIYKTKTELTGSEYYEMEEAVVSNEIRNNLIISITKELIERSRKILLLTKRIEHGKLLKERLKDINVIALSSEDPSIMRSELIQALRSEKKDFQVLIGTYGLFSTGIDLDMIDTILLGMSIKVDGDYDATLVQSVGRGLRLRDNKKTPLVIDLDDNLNKIMHRHHLSRKAVYVREGWRIVNQN